MQGIEAILSKGSDLVWSWPLIVLLFGTHIWTSGLSGAVLTKSAFSHIPYIGPVVLTAGLLTFVFSTILGWSYYGEKAVEYLFGIKAIKPYRYLWIAAVMVGAVMTMPAVWSLADIANGFMVFPNLISLIALTPVICRETKEYFSENSATSN